jgi:3-deoxy-7-phosphoheptulonate synthase
MAADGDAAADDLLERIDDLRIASIRPLMPAACLVEEVADSSVYETIRGARGALSAIARGRDPRLAVVVGPAAAHDPAAVLEFARRLKPVADSLRDQLVLVVRVFLDEPAGGAGRWSGAMYDPGLDGSFQVKPRGTTCAATSTPATSAAFCLSRPPLAPLRLLAPPPRLGPSW